MQQSNIKNLVLMIKDDLVVVAVTTSEMVELKSHGYKFVHIIPHATLIDAVKKLNLVVINE